MYRYAKWNVNHKKSKFNKNINNKIYCRECIVLSVLYHTCIWILTFGI